MASDWEKRAKADDHYQLVFGEGKKDTWSLKYNLIWDKLWKSGLFLDEVYERRLLIIKRKQIDMEHRLIAEQLIQRVTGFFGVQRWTIQQHLYSRWQHI